MRHSAVSTHGPPDRSVGKATAKSRPALDVARRDRSQPAGPGVYSGLIWSGPVYSLGALPLGRQERSGRDWLDSPAARPAPACARERTDEQRPPSSWGLTKHTTMVPAGLFMMRTRDARAGGRIVAPSRFAATCHVRCPRGRVQLLLRDVPQGQLQLINYLPSTHGDVSSTMSPPGSHTRHYRHLGGGMVHIIQRRTCNHFSPTDSSALPHISCTHRRGI